MKVYVQSDKGNWLMPTHPAKARVLLRQGKAGVIRRTPFCIRLLYETTGYVQPVTVGIDDGGVHVGIAAVACHKSLYQEELHLRTDIRSKLDTRRQYRKGRRYRKTRYRKARWQNRGQSIPVCKVCGGNAPSSEVICRACLRAVGGVHRKYAQMKKRVFRLPPSIRAKKDMIVRRVERIPMPIHRIILEDAYFDFQAMENPDITGEQYQHGELFYHRNYRQACLVRDRFTCRVCGGTENLRCHHVTPRSEGGTDRLSNLMTLCEACHHKHHNEGLKLPGQKSSFHVSAAHVQQGKNYLRKRLTQIAPLTTTFGYITAHYRNAAGVEKSHDNDAVIIADPHGVPMPGCIRTNHTAQRKRSLHEANPRKGLKQPNRTQKRNRKNVYELRGFRRWDTVQYRGRVGFISGFTEGAACRLVDISGKYITDPSKGYNQVPLSQISLIHRNQRSVSQWMARNSSRH